jgi:hypothetical protein
MSAEYTVDVRHEDAIDDLFSGAKTGGRVDVGEHSQERRNLSSGWRVIGHCQPAIAVRLPKGLFFSFYEREAVTQTPLGSAGLLERANVVRSASCPMLGLRQMGQHRSVGAGSCSRLSLWVLFPVTVRSCTQHRLLGSTGRGVKWAPSRNRPPICGDCERGLIRLGHFVRGPLDRRAHRQGGFCHEAGFVLGQGTRPTLLIGP